jgi:hypothetical protein
MKWFYMMRNDVTRHGAVDEPTLAEMARNGQLGPRDLVWNGESGTRWIDAASVPGLFPARKAEPELAPVAAPSPASAPTSPSATPAPQGARRRLAWVLGALVLLGVLLALAKIMKWL